MINATEIDLDWEFFDNVRKVTYYPFVAATETYGAPIPDVDAFSTGHSKQEVAAGDGAQLHNESCVYHLRMSQLNGIEPTKRGKIVDDVEGKTWIILGSVKVQTFGTRARCEVTRE